MDYPAHNTVAGKLTNCRKVTRYIPVIAVFIQYQIYSFGQRTGTGLSGTYLPSFVIIISVLTAWNFRHSSAPTSFI